MPRRTSHDEDPVEAVEALDSLEAVAAVDAVEAVEEVGLYQISDEGEVIEVDPDDVRDDLLAQILHAERLLGNSNADDTILAGYRHRPIVELYDVLDVKRADLRHAGYNV